MYIVYLSKIDINIVYMFARNINSSFNTDIWFHYMMTTNGLTRD